MNALTYLDPTQNYKRADVPAAVAVRADEFLAQHTNAEIQVVCPMGGNKWRFQYAVNRYTKRHVEYYYDFAVSA